MILINFVSLNIMITQKKKEYLCQIKIVEARELTSKNDDGFSNPFVKLRCANSPNQTSVVVYENLNPVWNQSFTFTNIMLEDKDFETAELRFEVWNRNRFFDNELIGMYSVGLSTLYRNAGHEFYQVWLTLTSPKSADKSQGFLKVDCFIIAQGDSPPVHSINDKFNDDVEEEDEDLNLDAMTLEELKAYQEKKQGIIILGTPQVARKAFELSCYVFKAENIIEFPGVVGLKKPTAFIFN